ncbi:MAG: hypothetical protein PHT84_06110, partial [Candidatus Pacebacteria bacterium]|nr:hypothetical protein [Candidatus Paceibacterota bacterium]
MKTTFLKYFKYLLILILIGGFFQIYASVTDGTIDPSNKSALLCLDDSCTTTSRINFLPTNGTPIHITDSVVTGHAWSETMGWIKFNPGTIGVTNTEEGILGEYAWGENAGWINFAPTNGGVTINSEGEFGGWAWAQNFGWIKFDCSVTDACVKTDWRPISARPSTGGGGTTSGSTSNPTTPTEPQEEPVDVCPNISGMQSLIPLGLVMSSL